MHTWAVGDLPQAPRHDGYLERATLHLMDGARRIAMVANQYSTHPHSTLPTTVTLPINTTTSKARAWTRQQASSATSGAHPRRHQLPLGSLGSGGHDKRYRYTGKEKDEETGPHYTTVRGTTRHGWAVDSSGPGGTDGGAVRGRRPSRQGWWIRHGRAALPSGEPPTAQQRSIASSMRRQEILHQNGPDGPLRTTGSQASRPKPTQTVRKAEPQPKQESLPTEWRAPYTQFTFF